MATKNTDVYSDTGDESSPCGPIATLQYLNFHLQFPACAGSLVVCFCLPIMLEQ